MRLLNSFFLRVRRSVVPLVCGLLLLFRADCSLFTLTMDDLQYSNPRAEVVYICDKPLDVPDGFNLWAYDTMTGRLVTAENPSELRYFVGVAADMLFEYQADAPASSVSKMPARFGLVCRKPKPAFPDSTPILPEASFGSSLRQTCPVSVAEVGPIDPRFLAQPPNGKKPSNTPVKGKKKKDPLYVHVCARPSWVKGDVNEWAMIKELKASRLTASGEEFAKQAENADTVFILDESAPPETVYWFVTDPAKLSCPGKPPRPYEQVERCKMLEMYAVGDSFKEAAKPALKDEWKTTSPSGSSPSGSGGQGTGQTKPTANPKGKGDGKTTETSSKDGKGPPLTFVEMFSNNLAIAAAIASGQTASAKDPNGSRYGLVGGTNVGGVDLLPLQMAVSIFAVVQNPFKTGKEFIDTVRRGFNAKKAVTILDPKVLTREIAEELATEPDKKLVQDVVDAWKKGDKKAAEEAFEKLDSFGLAMGPSLRDAAVIMPYSRAKIFTKGWGGDFQAHHLLEVDMAGRTLKMDAKAIDDIPAIVLSDAQHTRITNRLTEVRNEVLKGTGKDVPTPEQLWKIYQEAYKDCPSWLDAIKGYFPHAP